MSLFLCTSCNNVFDSNYIEFKKDINKDNICPINGCSGIPFQIDELMIEPIKGLNNKGYYTLFCCSGHIYDRGNPYIKFYESIDSAPESWYIDYTNNSIRHNLISEINTKERVLELADINTKLMEWVTNLKPKK